LLALPMALGLTAWRTARPALAAQACASRRAPSAWWRCFDLHRGSGLVRERHLLNAQILPTVRHRRSCTTPRAWLLGWLCARAFQA
jgi:hypothetical protein